MQTLVYVDMEHRCFQIRLEPRYRCSHWYTPLPQIEHYTQFANFSASEWVATFQILHLGPSLYISLTMYVVIISVWEYHCQIWGWEGSDPSGNSKTPRLPLVLISLTHPNINVINGYYSSEYLVSDYQRAYMVISHNTPYLVIYTNLRTSPVVKPKWRKLPPDEPGEGNGWGKRGTHLRISCSFSSSSLCLWITDSMIDLSSSVKWVKSGIGGRDGRLATDISPPGKWISNSN